MQFKPHPAAAPNHWVHALLAAACIPIVQSLMRWRRARAVRQQHSRADLDSPHIGIALSAAHTAFWSNNHVQLPVALQHGDAAAAGPADGREPVQQAMARAEHTPLKSA
jgi:hypothetical protein